MPLQGGRNIWGAIPQGDAWAGLFRPFRPLLHDDFYFQRSTGGFNTFCPALMSRCNVAGLSIGEPDAGQHHGEIGPAATANLRRH